MHCAGILLADNCQQRLTICHMNGDVSVVNHGRLSTISQLIARLGRIKLIHKNPGKQKKNRGKGHILGGTSPDTRQQPRSYVTSTDDLVRRPPEAQNDRPVVSFNFVFTLEALLTLFLYL
jgi:hypothetical protein